MIRTAFTALAALAIAAPLAAQAPLEKFDLAKPGLDAQARCAAIFSIVANEQRRGTAGADRFPSMADDGREFFVQTGFRLKAERNLDEDGVRSFFRELAGSIQKEYGASSNAGTKLDAEMKTCLEMKKVVVLPKPAG